MAAEVFDYKQYRKSLQRSAEAVRKLQQLPLEKGSGGGDSGGMEARVARLEDDAKELKADAKAIRGDLADIKVRIADLGGRFSGMEGRLSTMPTSLQLVGFAVAVFVAAGLFRFFEPRMFPMPSGNPPAVTAPR